MTSTSRTWQGIKTQKTPGRTALTWQNHAACIGEPLSTFFPEGPRQEAETDPRARALCSSCPVRTDCLDYSLALPEKYGRWGGLNEDERAAERRRRWQRARAHELKEQKRNNAPVSKPKRKQMVPAIGATRRLRAAAVAGRLLRTYSRVSGVPETTLTKIRSGQTVRISQERARTIAVAYPRVLALHHQEDLVVSRKAVANGWAPAGAWEGLDIDDPDARPHVGQEAA